MLTIGQLAAYAGVTVRAVRHYHQIGLLPEPERDASGYRRYGPQAAVSLIKIRTLASAGVPLSQIAQLLQADPPAFTDAVEQIDSRLRDEIDRLEATRKQIAQLTAGDSLVLPPEVVFYLGRLREIGVSEQMLETERDAWILVTARWPDHVREWMPAKLAELDDPQVVRFYRLASELFGSDTADDPRAEELADILADMLEHADAADQDLGEWTRDDLPNDLLNALADESDPRMKRFRELMRERGWAGWIRPERVPEPPALTVGYGGAVAGETEFAMGAEASCTDGPAGKVTRVIIDPATEAVTHLVIEPKFRLGTGRLVPLSLVEATAEGIRLRCTVEEFGGLEAAEETEVVDPLVGGLAIGGLGSPLGAGAPIQAYVQDVVPLGEEDIERGEPVHAVDGAIGRVKGVRVDPDDHRVTHVLLAEGHLWGRREVVIPASAVTKVENGIWLNLTKEQVAALPAAEG